MYAKPFTPDLLEKSVLAVPPLARDRSLALSEEANKALVAHIESGGVSTLLYGGNANLYHCGLSEYAPLLEMLERIAGSETWVIPSAGPTFGLAMDQARLLARTDFPTAMLLPMNGLTTPKGVAEGARRFADACGKPIALYVKEEGYLAPADLAALFEEGRVSFLKYAVNRADLGGDPYLRRIVEGFDPKRIVSGIGEQPAIEHMRAFGLAGFTAGCVCLTPRRSQVMLRRIQAGDFEGANRIREGYAALEALRESINPIRVLHEAVTLSGIADMGPMLPLMSGLEENDRVRVAAAVDDLMAGYE